MLKTLPVPAPFECAVERQGTVAIVRPSGELDLGSVSVLQTRLREAVQDRAEIVVLDLREVSFMGSTGLRIVLTWDAIARENGFAFRLIRGPRQVQRVFELTRVADRLRFVDA